MGKMWEKHDDPKWDENHLVKFPRGSIIFENIFCDVAEDELRSLKSAPTADACIAEVKPDGEPNLAVRNSTATRLRLVQTDFAARDTRYDNDPNHIGWVMGTFIYDGTKPNPDVSDVNVIGWDAAGIQAFRVNRGTTSFRLEFNGEMTRV